MVPRSGPEGSFFRVSRRGIKLRPLDKPIPGKVPEMPVRFSDTISGHGGDG